VGGSPLHVKLQNEINDHLVASYGTEAVRYVDNWVDLQLHHADTVTYFASGSWIVFIHSRIANGSVAFSALVRQRHRESVTVKANAAATGRSQLEAFKAQPQDDDQGHPNSRG
jgi:hypothetical protein